MPVQDRFGYFLPIWTEAPALRLLLPCVFGILLQQYLQFSLPILLVVMSMAVTVALALSISPSLKNSTRLGCCIQLLFICAGALMVWIKDISHLPGFIGTQYKDGSIVQATLQEPLVEKNKSYKAEASIRIFENNRLQDVKGHIIIYLQKDSSGSTPPLGYGNQIVFTKSLQEIHNAGNPGGFDYQRYCSFHGLYYQVFLKENEYKILNIKVIHPFRQMLFGLQHWVLKQFKYFIPGTIEAGVAGALLIGYRNDLDADLVKSYSNTGVVHIIAISGMHLGLIYGMLVLLFRPFGSSRKLIFIRAAAIIAILWMFSLLTGASPSIVRSAIMFTTLILGDIQQRKASIYNSLSMSALLILLVDPFSLWDVGFQLSYAALLSIAIFAGPVSSWFHIRNKFMRQLWKLNAVTIAAQVIPYPIVAFHFHQFPNLFLLTNLVAVPLSSVILYALLLLLAISWLPLAAIAIGKVAQWLIWLMNTFITQLSMVSFAVTHGIYFTIPQAIVLYLIIGACTWWLMRKSSLAFITALFSLGGFVCLRTIQFLQIALQQKLIIYHVPQHKAIDLLRGNRYVFIGDTILQKEGFLQTFHLTPSRVQHQVQKVDSLEGVFMNGNCIQAGNKKIILVYKALTKLSAGSISADILIISGNPRLNLAGMLGNVQPKIIVADGSNSKRKISQWQKEAEALHLSFHSVASDGAYELSW